MSDVAVRREPAKAPEPADLTSSELYFNRELSWLDFNERVLQITEDAEVPPLERMKFCAIWANNLDEFFMVRVAGLHDQVDAGIEKPGADGLTPKQTIERIREIVPGQHTRVSHALSRE